jgi:hypothetical protein
MLVSVLFLISVINLIVIKQLCLSLIRRRANSGSLINPGHPFRVSSSTAVGSTRALAVVRVLPGESALVREHYHSATLSKRSKRAMQL